MKTKFTLFISFLLVASFVLSTAFTQTIKLKPFWTEQASVYTMKFTADGKLVTGGIRSDNFDFGQIKVWRVKDSTLLQTISDFYMGVTNDIDVSNNAQTIISGHGSVKCGGEGGCYAAYPGLYEYTIKGTKKKFLNDSIDIIYSVAYSPDNTIIAEGTGFNNTGNIRLYDSAFNLVNVLRGNQDETSSIAFTPNGKYLVSGSDSSLVGLVKIWDYKTGKVVREMVHGDYLNGGAYASIDVSPDGKYIASTGNGYAMTTKVWRLADGKLIYTLPIHNKDYYGYATPRFSPDGNFIVSGVTLYGADNTGWHGEIYVWRLTDGKLVKQITDYDGAPLSGGVNSLAFSPAGDYFAYSVSNQLKLFTVKAASGFENDAFANAQTNNKFKSTAFPNPFSSTTTIQFIIPAAQFVNLTVYNFNGKEIATIINEKKAPGKYSVNFSAQELTAGIYYYQLSTEDYTEKHKLIISR
ncbi:MAG: T9SS type A sorting domain-containing protein [Parafilimonas sp.]|nr:T9SS type A sorting domain-containing protein [Parafilimonas sp.]